MEYDDGSINLNNEQVEVIDSEDEESLLPTENASDIINSPSVGELESEFSFNNIVRILDPGSSRELIQRWPEVAIALNIRQETIARQRAGLRMETIHIHEVYLTMLTEWRNANPENATLHALEEIFRSNGFSEATDRIRRNYGNIFTDLNAKLKKRRRTNIITAAIAFFVIASGTTILCFIEIQRSIGIQYRNSVPSLSSDYISRELTSRAELSTDKIFRTYIDDNALVFSGIDEYLVQELVKYGSTIPITTTLTDKVISIRYITGLQLVSEFDRLCEIKGDLSVHWLKYQANAKRFRWVDSCGTSMSFIQNAVNSTEDIIQEAIFDELPFFASDKITTKSLNTSNGGNELMYTISILQQPIIIYGSSGTGKSTLLASIGNAIQTSHWNCIVVFAGVVSFVQDVLTQMKQSQRRAQAVLNTVIARACKNSKCRSHLKSGIPDGTVKLVLLLDGFDQLSSHNIQDGVEVLKELLRWNSTLLFVTTRPNYLTKLENTLNSMAFQIEPFSGDKQIEYLVKVWSKDHAYLDNKRLQNYSVACVKEVQSRLSNKERDFTGIALLTYFIADVYKENATIYADPNNPTASGDPRIEFTSVYQLYDTLVSNWLSHFKNDIAHYKQLQLVHSYEAIRTKFPNISLENYILPVDDMRRIGIMEMSSDGTGKLEFMHPSFSDYFIAFFTLTCKLNSTLCTSVISSSIEIEGSKVFYNLFCLESWFMSYTFKYSLITYFWDASPLLEHIGQTLSQIEVKNEVILAATEKDFFDLFKIFYKSIFSERYQSHTGMLEELVLHAVKYSSLPLVQHILVDYISKSTQPLNNITVDVCSNSTAVSLHRLNVLELSARRGQFDIFNYIWQHFGLENIGKFIVHNIVATPFNLFEWKSQEIINGKISLIKFLVDTVGSSILDEYSEGYYQCTPLFYAYAKDLIIELIAQGVNTEFICANYDTGTILHYMANATLFSQQDYHMIMAEMRDRNLLSPRIVNYNNTYPIQWAPLEAYITEYPPKSETLQIFKNASADFVCRKETESAQDISTLFSLAIVCGQTPFSLKRLMPYVPYWKRGNTNNDTALIVALNAPHYSAARLFMALDPDQIHIRDSLGSTPLYRTILVFDKSSMRIEEERSLVKLLITSGADVNAVNGKHLASPLLQASKTADVTTVKYLVMSGANPNYTDAKNWTVLHYALSSEGNMGSYLYEIVRYLVEDLRVEVNGKNVENQTPLEYSIRWRLRSMELKTLNIFLRHGAVTSVYMANQILWIIIQCGLRDSRDSNNVVSEAASSVIGLGANLNYKDDLERTYLHGAVEQACLQGVIFLVDQGLDVNAKDKFGYTPLFMVYGFALKTKDSKTIYDILKRHGAHE